MDAQVKILAFIPAYRCEKQIGRVLTQFAQPDVQAWFAEILVLDNRSPDATVRVAMETVRGLGLGKISVARNVENFGLGGSHKAAFCYALANGFTHVVTLHGDDQGAIADLIPILEAKQHLAFDCCLGARFMPGSRLDGYSAIRVLGNHVFNGLFSLVSRRRLYDLGSGLNLYATNMLRDRYWWEFRDDLMFNYCMVLGHVARGDRVLFFPISWREDDQVSNVRLISQAWRTLTILGRFGFNRGSVFHHEFRDVKHTDYKFDLLETRL